MGGDHGPSVIVPAALQALQDNPDLHLILVGVETILQAQLTQMQAKSSRLHIQHASEQIEMDEAPASALRNKKDSSMHVALNLLKQGQVQACVSAGNTGALMVIARFVLKTLPHIDRPAIISALPTQCGHTYMLDLGANVDPSANHLLQFAVMGSALTAAVDNKPQPRIALLNIGEEKTKGNDRVQKAARLLECAAINYIGFVEGNDIFKGSADVVVCDGFAGNIALKTCEGVARMIVQGAKQSFDKNLWTRFVAWMALPILHTLHQRIDPRRYNGASLLGLQGIVIKSHGSADTWSFYNAIQQAIREIEQNIPIKISAQLTEILG